MWTLALVNVAAVCAVRVPAVRAGELVDVLIVVVAGSAGIPDDDLAVPVDVTRASGWARLHWLRPPHFVKHGSIEKRRKHARRFATRLHSIEQILVVIRPAQSFQHDVPVKPPPQPRDHTAIQRDFIPG